jgi:hypothetical protein
VTLQPWEFVEVVSNGAEFKIRMLFLLGYSYHIHENPLVKVKFSLEQATKAQNRSKSRL